jgi:hypothetical protein
MEQRYQLVKHKQYFTNYQDNLWGDNAALIVNIRIL